MESAERAILHVDMDAFFASVEALENPALRGKPLIVGGSGARGVVASCSYEARFYGVRSAMPSLRARRLCPQAIFVDGQYHLYEQYSRRMHEVFHAFTPLVEGISIDEAFLDVTGAQTMFGPPEEIAIQVRTRLRSDLGLSASVGVANTKHLAKLASVAAKPTATRAGAVEGRGVMVVGSSEAIDFLHPLPVRALWGLGPKSGERLAKVGITTVGELARLPVEQLALVLGEGAARHLHDLAWNRDVRPVEPDRPTKSVGHEQTYVTNLETHEQLHHQWIRLADAVAARLRKTGTSGRTITCKVRYGTFETITRSRTVERPTAHAATLASVADELTAAVDVQRGIRLLGLSVSNLESTTPVEQLSFDVLDEADGEDVLDTVIDRIRDRFGDEAVMPGQLIGETGHGLLRRGDQQWGPSAGGRKRPVRRTD